MLHRVLVIITAFLLVSCASKPTVVVSKPLIKSIAVVAATTPRVYTFNRTGSFGQARGLATSPQYRANEIRLTEKLAVPQFALGQEFTNAVATALRDHGYDVQVLQHIVRDPDDPDDVDYDKLSYSADAILHVWFDEIGVYVQRYSRNYIPRVNVAGRIYVKGHPQLLYDDTLYYGIDARPGKGWGIVAAPKYSYPDFEAVIGNIELLREGLAVGAQEIGKRMAERIHTTIK